jgi:hypothetical protein
MEDIINNIWNALKVAHQQYDDGALAGKDWYRGYINSIEDILIGLIWQQLADEWPDISEEFLHDEAVRRVTGVEADQ